MNDPSRLEQLRFLERVQQADLERTRRWITAEEQRQTETRTRHEQTPAVPDWTIEPGINPASPAVYVHVGGCHMAGKRQRAATREQAVQALIGGVDACTHCRPDTELGLLE